jgi:RNA polymerase sigma-70 factor (ECF subfamily)
LTDQEFMDRMELYHNMVYRLAMTYMRNIQYAEDITQEVFIKLYKHNKVFASLAEEKAWLIRVTINACKDLLKSAWLKRTVPMDENLTFQNKEKSELFYAVMSLGKKDRLIIHLYYYEDYSVKEIAKLLHIRQTTVQTRLYRARKKLEEILTSENSPTSIKLKEEVYETGI